MLCFAGFQTWIGQVDVKSSPVHFYVQKNANFYTQFVPIPFEKEILNVGGAMNLTSGKFTAPRDGIYSFSFTGRGEFPDSSSTVYLYVHMYLNGTGNEIGRGGAHEEGTCCKGTWHQIETFSFQSTINLQKGDQIWLQISNIAPSAYLTGNYFTQFSGYLLEENFSQLLKDM